MRVGRLAMGALAVALIMGSSSPVAAQQGEQSYETTSGKSKPVYEDSIVEEYRVKTRYGEIYGVVRRPVVPEGLKVPVILTYTPYSILGEPFSPLLDTGSDDVADYFVPRGYARAVFDLVGTNGSGGCYDYGGIRERKTGKAVIDFLGKRGWSNGRVGMIGGSYDGTTQFAAAIERPKHLTTIIPQVAIDRWWDYAFSQGVRYASGSGTPYLFDYGFGMAPPTHTTDPTKSAQTMPDKVNPCERLEHNDRAFLPDPEYDSFWDERDYRVRAHKIRASVMIEGSWVDSNVHPRNSIYMWDALPEDLPKRLVMAQQGHAGANLSDSINIRHAWFDYWLLGLDTGVMDLPQVDSLVNGGRRFQQEGWSPSGTRMRSLLLAPPGTAGALSLTDADEPVWTDSDPQLSESSALQGSGGEADLLFVGEPTDEEVRISGIPVLRIKAVTDRENTWVTPVLFEEDESGDREVITTGLFNARNRFGDRKSIPLVPGEPWSGRVEFQPTDYVVGEGHRIGVAVMSMNSSEALYWSTHPSTNELFLGGPTRLLLPVASPNAGCVVACSR